MKTMNNSTSISYIYKVDQLATKIKNPNTIIEKYVKDNNYQLSGDALIITNANLESGLLQLSKRGLKRINKAIYRVEKCSNLRGCNMFFHYIMKDVLKSQDRIKIDLSVKELAIKSKRNEWKKAQVIVDKLLKDYKDEKGNFYKQVIAN